MKKELRKQQALKRKNFFPALLVTVVLWMLLGALVYFVNPEVFAAVPLFFVTFFIALLFTFSLIFAGSRMGLIFSSSLTLFLMLCYLGVGNILNFILILAIAVCTELYFSRT